MPEVNGINVPFIPIEPSSTPVSSKPELIKSNFRDLFETELEKIKFSNHATKRLEARNINIDEETIAKIQTAVGKAEAKGSRDSLVMVNNTAFIVNIPNKVVVTAMPVGEGEENIFTNIDSVVFSF